MSSHHVIRENQEGALLVLSKRLINLTILESFLEWSPIIVANIECFNFLNKHGIKVDAVIGTDDEFQSQEEELNFQYPIRLIQRNESAIDDGIKFLLSKESSLIYVWEDLQKPQIFELQKDYSTVSLSFVNENNVSHVISSCTYEKWFPGNASIQIFPLNENQKFSFSPQNALFKKGHSTDFIDINIKKEGSFEVNSNEVFVIREWLID